MPTTRTDPIRNFKFEVQFIPNANVATGGPTATETKSPGASNDLYQFTAGLGSIGFASMSGLSVRNELIAYREGGMNTHPHKMVGQTDFDPVTFSRGIISNQDQLWKWQRFIHNWQSGVAGSKGGAGYRCDILVYVYDHPHSNASYTDSTEIGSKKTFIGTPKLGIKIFNAWPGAYAVSGLNAGDNAIMIQELALHNEGWILAFSETDITNLKTAK